MLLEVRYAVYSYSMSCCLHKSVKAQSELSEVTDLDFVESSSQHHQHYHHIAKAYDLISRQ